MSPSSTMSRYELEAIKQIEAWRNPPQAWFNELTDRVTKPVGDVANWALDNPVGNAMTGAMNKAMHGVLGVLNDGASWTIREDDVFKKYRAAGHDGVRVHKDIFDLDLEHVDRVVGFLNAQYVTLGAAEGAATGAAGLPGLVADVPAIFGLNLRAIADYATHYGFDVSNQAERAYIMQVLNYSISPSGGVKQAALAELIQLSKALAAKKSWDEIQKIGAATALKKVAEAVGIRVTKAKMGQVVPIAGAVVGGGFNAWFTRTNCDAAYHLYRERFLGQRHST